MKTISSGARRLPMHHITIRVPWHDSGWAGTVCQNPLGNTSCLVLKGIGPRRQDDAEQLRAGQALDTFAESELPPCVNERASFMAPFALKRKKNHPYVQWSDFHKHFLDTDFVQPAYSAACVPFRWLLRENVEGNAKRGEVGIAERLQLGYASEREPVILDQHGKEAGRTWLQEKGNQRALLDTFFGALRPEESLCFFYAKSTPLSEQSRRVIVGVGRVLTVGKATEYALKPGEPPLRSVIWERNVGHSIRPRFVDGFLFPYQNALELAGQKGINPEEFVAFAPDEYFEAYSYCSELLPHDGAVASLVACAAALSRIREQKIEGPWDKASEWIDKQLNRLWKARGAFPGLGSSLAAFGYEYGFQHGSLLAYDVERLREDEDDRDSLALVDAVMDDPKRLGASPVVKLLQDSGNLRKGWQRLTAERRALLELLSRCEMSEGQALRFYDQTQRGEAGLEVTDKEILENPYRLFEADRTSADAISFGTVDRGLFPDAAIQKAFPIPEPARISDQADVRRVRALVVDLLEEAGQEGHTLLPQSWVIKGARERGLQPACNLGEGILSIAEERFSPVVSRVATSSDEPAYQVDRLANCRMIVRREVTGRMKGRRHAGEHHWRAVVDAALDAVLDEPLPEGAGARELEERARAEKAIALEELFQSRISVLIGSAGTGKTTLLRMLCSLPGLSENGVLLLAPTGKARVRLEEQTGRQGEGQTLAQFLIRRGRYDGKTGTYSPNASASKCSDYRTVIIDECSMLTEEQLAALLDSLQNVERLVLVGDPRQLPPIGAGRPFVDIVKHLEPDGIELQTVKCGACYAELTVSRRQQGSDREDVGLALHYSGRPLSPGVDTAFDPLAGTGDGNLRLVQWDQPRDLHSTLMAELVRELGLAGVEDELGFEESLGGQRHGDIPWAFFWNKYRDNPGAAAKAEAWQILSPVRAGLVGVEALNRSVQVQFRGEVRKLAESGQKVPKAVGRQGLLYGDKVINVVNQRRVDVWPAPEGEAYLANGDIGIIVGQYQTKKLKGRPWKIQVEFASQTGPMYGFSPAEFSDDGTDALELAYCLTVHKTQGSEFGTTFVVLTNPCWLLSRELLYTALTRHKGRLVVLHQGPLAEYRKYSSDEYSEIARRMTNLFVDPSPCEVGASGQQRFLENGLIHRATDGTLVRSKSELVIANQLHAHGVDYAYEQPLPLDGGITRYPDFTIADHASGITYYWEHLGMLDDPDYRARWERKRTEYLEAGVQPLENAENADKILIETEDQSGGALDAEEIAMVINKVFP